MSEFAMLSEAKLDLIKPFFPLSHGLPILSSQRFVLPKQ